MYFQHFDGNNEKELKRKKFSISSPLLARFTQLFSTDQGVKLTSSVIFTMPLFRYVQPKFSISLYYFASISYRLCTLLIRYIKKAEKVQNIETDISTNQIEDNFPQGRRSSSLLPQCLHLCYKNLNKSFFIMKEKERKKNLKSSVHKGSVQDGETRTKATQI